jgi:hypothetical protein
MRNASSSGSHATAGLSANDARHAGCLVGDIAADARRGGDLRGLDGCAAGCKADTAGQNSSAGTLRCCHLAAAGCSGLHAGRGARPLDDAWDGSSARLNRLAACGATARASATADAWSASELRTAAGLDALWADAGGALRADSCLRAASLWTELSIVRTARHALLGAAACVSRAAGAALLTAFAAFAGRPAPQRVALLLRQLAQRARRCSGTTKAPRMTSVELCRDAGESSLRAACAHARAHPAC